jgi:alkylated DNA repair dioxygenase AlkB
MSIVPDTSAIMHAHGFTSHALDDGHGFLEGRLPEELLWNEQAFDHAWGAHPAERHWVKMWGKSMQVARWQQAYGANYAYTGSLNNALPVPAFLGPLLEWSRTAIDGRLNGLLLNWYEGEEHYIGPHSDSTDGLAAGSVIVTISFGEERLFRLEQGIRETRRVRDFTARDGGVFVLPWETNRAWKHSVPKRAANRGRRISVTLRAFTAGVLPPDEYFEP